MIVRNRLCMKTVGGDRVLPPSGESEVVLWCYSDGYQGQEGAHDRGTK